MFTSDAQRLVLDPIERMVKMVEYMVKDPLNPVPFNHAHGSGEYETRLLENTIEKITGLLRVGFGEAGAGIISSNLKFEDNTSVIDPLIPGKRVYAIFGFCEIHGFEDINESLGKEVMTFVNTIAEIVHSSVHTWAGSSNKNLGNSFVVVWRLGDEATLTALSSSHALSLRRRGSGTIIPPRHTNSSNSLAALSADGGLNGGRSSAHGAMSEQTSRASARGAHSLSLHSLSCFVISVECGSFGGCLSTMSCSLECYDMYRTQYHLRDGQRGAFPDAHFDAALPW